jgi:hypothetical protein
VGLNGRLGGEAELKVGLVACECGWECPSATVEREDIEAASRWVFGLDGADSSSIGWVGANRGGESSGEDVGFRGEK